MRARRSWIVFIDDDPHIYCPEDLPGRYIVDKHVDTKILSIMFDFNDAKHIAQRLSQQFPGKDVHVYQQILGYTSQPQPVQSKIWTDKGEYIPEPK